MRASVVCFLLAVVSLAACEREPAIVIRFDPVDAKAAHAAPVVVDASPGDAGLDASVVKTIDKTMRHPSGQCVTEDDCALVTDGCCDCANGGKLVAMTKVAAAQAAKKKNCKDVMCTMMVSTDPSCGKRPACIGGTCTMRGARPDERKGLRLP